MGPGADPERSVALETLMVLPMTTLVKLGALPSSGLGPIDEHDGQRDDGPARLGVLGP